MSDDEKMDVRDTVSVLLSPATLIIVDIFRSLREPDHHGDSWVLKGFEQSSRRRRVSPGEARTLVSESLLLAFALNRQRGRPLSHHPRGVRRGTIDEYALLTLIAASREPEVELIYEACAALGVESLEFITPIAADLARHWGMAGFPLNTPKLVEFRAIVGKTDPFDAQSAWIDQSAFKF